MDIIINILGVVLIVGIIWWFWLSGDTRGGKSK